MGCAAAPAPLGAASGGVARARIACVMQLGNEERYLQGCLAHLRDHVDGVWGREVRARFFRLPPVITFDEDRERRRDRYEQLDPEGRFQAVGCDYLAEEGDGLGLEAIAPGRECDDSLPAPELRAIP